MKKLLFLFLTLISVAGFAQSGSINISTLKSQVKDSTTVVKPSGWGVIYYNYQSSKWRYCNGAGVCHDFSSGGGGGGSGDVTGPGASTNNNVVFFNGTTGKIIKDSGLTLSGSNTGDQTITLTGAVTGSGTGSFATTIATPGTLTVSSTNSTATAHTHAITSSSAPGAAASILATDASGIIGSTGTRIVKGWFTDITVTNAISGSVTGNAGTATALATGRTIGIATGDATSAGSSFDGTANNTNALTLATVNSNVGSFTYGSFTVNAKGLITAASSGTAPATGTGSSGRVAYWSGASTLTSNSAFLFDGTNLGVGATPQSVLTIAGQTSIQAPVSSSTAQFIGVDANPLRITFDTHNNSNASGTAFMGRRSRGTAASPSALSSGDDIISLNGRGYGSTGYAAASTGLITLKANQTFTDANMGTYATIYTTPDNSVTAAEALRITGAGVINAIQSGGKYQINSTDVLSSSTLGSGVTASSLTSFGSSPTIITPSITTGFTIGGAAASGKFIVGNGTNFVPSTSTIPSTAGAVNTSLISDGTNYINSTVTRPNSATTGDVLYASGSNAYANLAAVATGSVLGSAGTSTAPAYLATSNGLTATSSALKWGGPITANTSVTGAFAIDFTNNAPGHKLDGTYTATANNQSHWNFTGTITTRATASDTYTGYSFTPSLTAGSTTQNIAAVRINPTWSTTNSPNNVGLWITVGTGDAGALPLYIETTAGARLYQFSGTANLTMGSSGTASYACQTSGSVSATGRGPALGTTISASNNTGILLTHSGGGSLTDGSTANKKFIDIGLNYAASSGSNGIIILNYNGSINTTGTFAGTLRFLDYNPTYTSTTGLTEYFITNRSTTAKTGLGVASPAEMLEVGGNVKTNHLIGRTTAPTGAVGTGAGTSPSAVTFSTNATDLAGIVSVTTGTLPTAAATVLTVTFNTAYGTAPVPTLTPANAATALLSGVTMVIATSTTTTFVITAGSTGLVAATAYSWNYQIIQ